MNINKTILFALSSFLLDIFSLFASSGMESITSSSMNTRANFSKGAAKKRSLCSPKLEALGAKPHHLETFCEFTEAEILEILDKGYTFDHIAGAIRTKKIHDNIELAAYKALAQGIKDLKITADKITSEQSMILLHEYVKKQAHIVMRGPGGYMPERGKHLDFKKQMSGFMPYLSWVIHDRDRRLTNGIYTSLTELVYALDSHNSVVNEHLFKAWGYPLAKIHQQLNTIRSCRQLI